MASIIGEKYHNAGGEDLASINAAIASTTAELNKATALYNQASTALTTCYKKSRSECLKLTGGYAHSTWSPQYETNKALVDRYKKELEDLLKTQASLAKTQGDTQDTVNKKALADEALAKADSATTDATGKKALLYIGIGIGVLALIFGGIVVFKKVKK